MRNVKSFMARLADPDRIMDLFVDNRWDTAESPASQNSNSRYYFDRSGALIVNNKNADVRRSFDENINALASKKLRQG
ncbi:hypothetical protein V2154_02400 [Ewingella sp. CoE-038-23]|uniref:hypothetical protein n=1 Tax=Ewingella docleensis TaxID=3118588 RepID=UPI0033655C55